MGWSESEGPSHIRYMTLFKQQLAFMFTSTNRPNLLSIYLDILEPTINR